MRLFNFNIYPFDIKVDESKLVYFPLFGRIKTIPWKDLIRVEVQTTDQGPFLEDLFYVLVAKRQSVRISEDEAAYCSLMTHFKNLKDFNFDAIVSASSCVENRTYLCWQAEK